MSRRRRWIGLSWLLLGGLWMASGCATVQQTEACKAYVSCLEARDTQMGIKTDVLRFQPQGGCWGSPEGSEFCTRACENGLRWMQQSYKDLPQACR